MKQVVATLALVLLLADPLFAQIRYKDDEGVMHFVNSLDEVPEKYRAGAVGRPVDAAGARSSPALPPELARPLPAGCVYVKHPEWVTMTRPELLNLVQLAKTRQRAIKARQALVETEQRGIEADARFYGRPIGNLDEYQAKRRQAILDVPMAERDELDAQYASDAVRLDPTSEWRRTQSARKDCGVK